MPDSATDQVEVFETIDELVAAISPSETDVIVLCGLPGCGKSSFTEQWNARTANGVRPTWVRVCQDEEGSRKACMKRVGECFHLPPQLAMDPKGKAVATSPATKRANNIKSLEQIIVAKEGSLPEKALVQMRLKLERMREEHRLLSEEQDNEQNSEEPSPELTPVVIDRCNFDVGQRKPWVDLSVAAKVPIERRICVVIGTPPMICAERATLRRNHPTLEAPVAASIVHRMFRDFRFPTVREGFSRVLMVNTTGGPSLADFVLDAPLSARTKTLPCSFLPHLPNEDQIAVNLTEIAAACGDWQRDFFNPILAKKEYQCVSRAPQGSGATEESDVLLSQESQARDEHDERGDARKSARALAAAAAKQRQKAEEEAVASAASSKKKGKKGQKRCQPAGSGAGSQPLGKYIRHPAGRVFSPAYAGLFLTSQSRKKAMCFVEACPELPEVVLDHVTIQHLERSSGLEEFRNVPVPGVAAHIEAYGMLKSNRVSCLLVRGSVCGRPLQDIVASGYPHITLAKLPYASAYEAVRMLRNDAEQLASGGRSEVKLFDEPLTLTCLSGVQVRTHDSGPLVRLFDPQSAETMLGLRWPAATAVYAAVQAHRLEERKPTVGEESSATAVYEAATEAATNVVDRLYTPRFCGGSTGSSADVVPPENLCSLFVEVHDFASAKNGAEYVHVQCYRN
eukprot:INCI5110.10.p1 GENE.INCI5110.10~~INCI5110.10.p1  ORF type:complete len:682 (-),score=104.58 INCI5110.10:3145-5190(-)